MNIAIIGKKFKGLSDFLADNGHSYRIFLDTHQNSGKKAKENCVLIDFEDSTNVIETISGVHAKTPFDAVLTIYEQYIVITSEIAEKLGLRGLSKQAAIACTDKSIMRELFSRAPKKISPDFQRVESRDQLLEFANSHDYPLILKPANLAKSLLVTKNHNENELLENYQKMQDQIDKIYKKYAPHNERIVLIEEFLEGSIHSIDAFINERGEPTLIPHIVDYQTGYDIGFDDNFHYSRLMPSTLSEDEQNDFIETAKIAIKSLGMTSSAAHVEIIMTKNGPRIVEIGARNGGYRERMHKMGQGIDVYQNLLSTMVGEPLSLTEERNQPVGFMEVFPKENGFFEEIQNLDQLKKLPSLQYLSVKYKSGDQCGKSSDGYKAACIIGISNADPAQFKKDKKFIDSDITVRIS